ncbi:PREDICTED: uncharacterized protein LOC109178688 [Ipomoea nil]|uniref:uncharacterized protein LOC109178688 n=1 Tax=Ipomoea nil TaxID=35883 RepID=UPI000901F0A6|nr:PREDICTED: uncharacterized protein LOC109178688 [Ipomoea nil]
MSSSSSCTRRRYNVGGSVEIRECECGNELVIRTSWTDRNPGRRFFHCSESPGRKGCGFFEWTDPPMCPRSICIIPGLLKRINRDREEMGRLKAMLNAIAKEKEEKSKGKTCCKISGVIVFSVVIAIFFVFHVFTNSV